MEAQHLAEIDNFHKVSFFWSYLLNFSGMLEVDVPALLKTLTFLIKQISLC